MVVVIINPSNWFEWIIRHQCSCVVVVVDVPDTALIADFQWKKKIFARVFARFEIRERERNQLVLGIQGINWLIDQLIDRLICPTPVWRACSQISLMHFTFALPSLKNYGYASVGQSRYRSSENFFISDLFLNQI